MNNNTKAEQRAIRAAILTLFDRIVEGYPDLTISQHVSSIFRSKGKSPKDVYLWDNKETLHRMEKYYEELENNPPQTWGTFLENL